MEPSHWGNTASTQLEPEKITVLQISDVSYNSGIKELIKKSPPEIISFDTQNMHTDKSDMLYMNTFY